MLRGAIAIVSVGMGLASIRPVSHVVGNRMEASPIPTGSAAAVWGRPIYGSGFASASVRVLAVQFLQLGVGFISRLIQHGKGIRAVLRNATDRIL